MDPGILAIYASSNAGAPYGTANFLFDAVPEPASLSLLAVGGLLLLRKRAGKGKG